MQRLETLILLLLLIEIVAIYLLNDTGLIMLHDHECKERADQWLMQLLLLCDEQRYQQVQRSQLELELDDLEQYYQ